MPDSLARLTPDQPDAGIPVRVFASRCDGHIKGEIKKPFAFLVWVGEPGGEIAIRPTVDDDSIRAFRQVCSF